MDRLATTFFVPSLSGIPLFILFLRGERERELENKPCDLLSGPSALPQGIQFTILSPFYALSHKNMLNHGETVVHSSRVADSRGENENHPHTEQGAGRQRQR